MLFLEVPLHFFMVGVWYAVGKNRITGLNTYIVHTLTPFLKLGRFRENLCLVQQKSATTNTAEFQRKMNTVFVKFDACWAQRETLSSTVFKQSKMKAKLNTRH